MYSELRDKGLEVALISFRENAEPVRRTVKERGYFAPVLLDETGDVHGVWGPPTVYFAVRQGRRARSSRPCWTRASREGRG